MPKGTVLSDKQQKAFEKLKSQHEPALHAALDQVAAAKGQDAKTKATAAMGVRDERAKIHAGIQQILAMPYQEALDRSNKYGQANSSSADGNSAGAAPGYNNNYTPAYNDYYYRMYGRYPVGAASGGYYTYGYYNAPNATSSNSSKPKSGRTRPARASRRFGEQANPTRWKPTISPDYSRLGNRAKVQS